MSKQRVGEVDGIMSILQDGGFYVVRAVTADWVGGKSSLILALDQIGIDTEAGEVKFGDGVNVWGSLPTISLGNALLIANNLSDVANPSLAVARLHRFTTTATAGSTTTLTVTSTRTQVFTGTQTQIVRLPVVSTLLTGFEFLIINNSTDTLTVQPSGGLGTVQEILAGNAALITCILVTGTTTASWDSISFAAGASIPFTAASASAPASLAFAEDTDNGVHAVTVKAPAAVTANVDFTLPDAAGTAALISQVITNGVTTHSPSEDAVFDALALKQTSAWTVVEDAAASISPAAADSGTYYRCTNAAATFNLPDTDGVVGSTYYWVQFTGGNGLIEPGTDALEGTQFDSGSFVPASGSNALGILQYQTVQVRCVATNTWAIIAGFATT